ncbi:hypothetical protein NHQ30_006143 [Ciborinia camelliae]|nr:hypothetical protein NHQ30_006143 [Ciborinia camelliae]
MSTPRVSRTLVRAAWARMEVSSARYYTTSRFSTCGRSNFGAQIRDGGLKSVGVFGRDQYRQARQVGQVRDYSQENERGQSKQYTFEDVCLSSSLFPLPLPLHFPILIPSQFNSIPINQPTNPSLPQMQKLSSTPLSTRPSTHIIDVRTPLELQQTGRIPTALNIPITTFPDAFSISEEEFEDRFGFERPSKEDECVFYCKAGVRSRVAAEIARANGWEKVGEFQGSWGEWSGKGGEVEK